MWSFDSESRLPAALFGESGPVTRDAEGPVPTNAHVVLRATPIKPKSDENAYRFLRLANGLRVMLVSDPKADKGAAACSVAVGHMADPRELAGLSHFLEHMLFYSSERYPDEGSYKAFLKAHGGGCNASTGAESTTYHLFVHHAHLREALDRFAQFFIAPTISSEGSGREVNAVDSENSKNLNVDGRRQLQVRKDTVNRAHDYSKFGTGNLTTLHHDPVSKGIDVHAALLDHYRRYYSANIMMLSVLGREDLNTLEAWVTGGGVGGEAGAAASAAAAAAAASAAAGGAAASAAGGSAADSASSSGASGAALDSSAGAAAVTTVGGSFVTEFHRVRNTGIPVPVDHSKGHPMQAAQLGKWVFLVPVRDRRAVSLLWPMPSPSSPDYGRAHSSIAYCIGHEGPGSLLSLLKRQQWASELSAGASHYDHFSSFSVDISLTPDGLANATSVIGLVYDYIRLLQRQPAAFWQRVHEETAQVSANAVRFRPKASPLATVTGAVESLRSYPGVDALVAGSLKPVFEPTAVADALRVLGSPRNMIVELSAKECRDDVALVKLLQGPSVSAAPGDAASAAAVAPFAGTPTIAAHVERFYGVPYKTCAMTADHEAQWTAATHTPPAAVAADVAAADLISLLASHAPSDALEAAVATNGWTISASAPSQLSRAHPSLHVPAPNPFIASDFSLAPLPASAADVAPTANSGAGTAAAASAQGVAALATLTEPRVDIEPPASASAAATPVLPSPGGEVAEGSKAHSVAIPAAASVEQANKQVDVIVVAPTNGTNGAADAAEVGTQAALPSRSRAVLRSSLLDLRISGAAAGASTTGSSSGAAAAAAGSLWSELSYDLVFPELALVEGSGVAAGAVDAASSSGNPADTGVIYRLWHKQDDKFRLPRSMVTVQLNPVVYPADAPTAGTPPDFRPAATPREFTLDALATLLLNDLVTESTYDAERAGLGFSLGLGEQGGASVSVSGFSHKLPVLLRRVSELLQAYAAVGASASTAAAGAASNDPGVAAVTSAAEFTATFKRKVDTVLRAHISKRMAQPHERVAGHMNELLTRPSVRSEDVVDVLTATQSALEAGEVGATAAASAVDGGVEPITPADVRARAAQLLGLDPASSSPSSRRRMVVEAFVYGNNTTAMAKELAQLPMQCLTPHAGASPAPATDATAASAVPWPLLPGKAVLLLPARSSVVFTREHPNPAEPNCAVQVMWQLGAFTHRNYAIVRLLAVLINQPCFDTLRTKEQLGYIVSSGVSSAQVMSLAITVQSSIASVQHIMDRIDAFIEAFRATHLSDAQLTVESLRTKQDVLAHQIMEPDKTPSAEFARLQSAAAGRRVATFHESEALAAAVRAVSPDDIRSLFDACVAADGRLLRKVAMRVHAQATTAGAAAPGDSTDTASKLLGGGPSAVSPHVLELTSTPDAFKSAVPQAEDLPLETLIAFMHGEDSHSLPGVWVPPTRVLRQMLADRHGVPLD